MHVRQEKFFELIEETFEGSYSRCAKELKVDNSTVWRVANGQSRGGVEFITKLMQYCNEAKINYHDIIFLD